VIVVRQQQPSAPPPANALAIPGSSGGLPPRLRRVLRILFHVVLISGIVFGLVTLHYFIKFSAIVDARLKGEVYRQSARIYAAVPESAQSPLGTSAKPVSALVGYQSSSKDDASALMTSFFDASRARRRSIEFQEIPKVLINGVLAGEDRVFFNHYGLHPKRIVGAFVSNLKQDGHLQGASTITQQLARNLFLDRNITLRRKLSEAFIAIILESRLTKEQIFTMYANEVYLGHRDSFGIHGFAEASKAYFGKDMKDLTLSEAATLAGIIPAPNAFSPVHHADRAEARRNLILKIMLDSGDVTQQQYEEARRSHLKIAPNIDPTEGHYIVDYIRDELLHDFPEEELMSGGLSVYTTVDLKLQTIAKDAVRNGLALVNAQLTARRGNKKSGGPTPQAGLIALDPHTGEIKAMVGGTQYGASQYNRITHAFRQPGSIFKPFVYTAALETALEGFTVSSFNPDDEEGTISLITPLTTLIDEPMVFYSGDKNYAPRNYKGQYHGAVTLRSALQQSMNIPTVMLAQKIGYDRVVSLARRMGMNPQIRGYPSVALGAFEVTPIEIAGAYTAFANEGQRVQPHAVRSVESHEHRVLKRYDPQPQTVLSPQVAYLMTHLMEGVINQGTGAGVRARGFTLPAAGKTGTSRDGWFVGYTKNLLVIAWVGFDDGHDLNLEGARSALPIWTEFMKKAYALYPAPNSSDMQFKPPSGIEFVPIDSATHLRGDPYCGESFVETFLTGTAPETSCVDAVPVPDPSALAGTLDDGFGNP
jgi:penicillin-binding protein 1B